MSKRILLFACSMLVLAIGPALADVSAFAPQSVVHALYLQTQGVLASMAVVEPCTTGGMLDAVKRANAAVENQDVMTIETEQGGFAVGFAHCALEATTSGNFAAFCSATIQSGTAVIAAHKAMGILEPADKAKAQQYYTIAKFLQRDSAASSIDRHIASATINSLRRMSVI